MHNIGIGNKLKCALGAMLLACSLHFAASAGFAGETDQNTLENGVFRHGASGLTLKIPQGWKVEGEEAALQKYEASKKSVEAVTNQKIPLVASPAGDLVLAKPEHNSFNYKVKGLPAADQLDSAIQKIFDVSVQAYEKMAEPQGLTVKSEPAHKTIAGIDFRVMDIKVQSADKSKTLVTNITYIAPYSGSTHVLTAACVDEGACDEIRSMIEGMTVTK